MVQLLPARFKTVDRYLVLNAVAVHDLASRTQLGQLGWNGRDW